MGYDSLNGALEVLGGKTLEPVTNTPTIYFGRGMDALIKQFMDTEGNAVFEVPAERAERADAAGEKPLDRGCGVPERHVHADGAGRHAGGG